MPGEWDRTFETVQALYAAALRPELWPDVLESYCGLFDGATAVLFLQDIESGEIPFWLGHATENGEDEYREHIKDVNPRVHFSMSNRPGTLACDYRVLPEAGMDRHPFYDWLERKHNLRYFIGTRLFEEGSLNAFVGVDWEKRHGHAQDDDVLLLNRLKPHFEQAMRLTMALNAANTHAVALDAALHFADCGIVTLDARGQVVHINALAEEILTRNDGLSLENGELQPYRASDRRMLGQMIAAALAERDGQSPPAGANGLIARNGIGAVYIVSAFAVPAEPFATVLGEAAVLVVIRDNTARIPLPELLRNLYGLTDREADVAAHLQSGAELSKVAAELGMALNTARAHLRSIFLKTGVSSQAQLAILLARLPGAAS